MHNHSPLEWHRLVEIRRGPERMMTAAFVPYVTAHTDETFRGGALRRSDLTGSGQTLCVVGPHDRSFSGTGDGAVMQNSTLSASFLTSIARPHCSKCGTLMLQTRIEPNQPDHDRRNFECKNCGHIDVSVVKHR